MNKKAFPDYFHKSSKSLSSQELENMLAGKMLSFGLITGRCGSTYLTGLLKKMNDIGLAYEFLNEDFMTSDEMQSRTEDLLVFEDYLEYAVQTYARNDVFSMQADWPRLEKCLSSNLLDISFFHCKSIKYYALFRRNIVLQAISYLQAIETNFWHLFGQVRSEEIAQVDSIDDRKIIDFIIHILDSEYHFIKLLEQCSNSNDYLFYYEDFVAEPYVLVSYIYRSVGLNISFEKLHNALLDKRNHMKIFRSSTPKIYLKFLDKYEVVRNLLTYRLQTSQGSAQIGDWLNNLHNLRQSL